MHMLYIYFSYLVQSSRQAAEFLCDLWTAALCSPCASSTLSFQPISISMMPSNYLISSVITFLLLPSVFPGIRVFSKESVLTVAKGLEFLASIRKPSSNEYSGPTFQDGSRIFLKSYGLQEFTLNKSYLKALVISGAQLSFICPTLIYT